MLISLITSIALMVFGAFIFVSNLFATEYCITDTTMRPYGIAIGAIFFFIPFLYFSIVKSMATQEVERYSGLINNYLNTVVNQISGLNTMLTLQEGHILMLLREIRNAVTGKEAGKEVTIPAEALKKESTEAAQTEEVAQVKENPEISDDGPTAKRVVSAVKKIGIDTDFHLDNYEMIEDKDSSEIFISIELYERSDLQFAKRSREQIFLVRKKATN